MSAWRTWIASCRSRCSRSRTWRAASSGWASWCWRARCSAACRPPITSRCGCCSPASPPRSSRGWTSRRPRCSRWCSACSCSGGARSTVRPRSSRSASPRCGWWPSPASSSWRCGSALISYRHVEYSHDLWWTFALDGNAPRMLRASLAVIVLGSGLRAVEHAAAGAPRTRRSPVPQELERARALIAGADLTVANAALTGDKRLLFRDAGDAFVMYQIAGHSWIALGDPVGSQARRGGARVAAARDLRSPRRPDGLLPGVRRAARAVRRSGTGGAQDRRGSARARSRISRSRAPRARTCGSRTAARSATAPRFEVVPPEEVEALLPALQRISDAWLASKSTGEKRFSVGAFTPEYVRQFPVAVVRSQGDAGGVRQPVDHGHPGPSCRWI